MHLFVRSVRRGVLLLGFGLFGALFLGVSFVFAGGTDAVTTTTNYVYVSGTGKVSVDPDMAVVSFTVQTTDTTAKLAQAANAEIVSDIKIALKDAGVPINYLKTSYFYTYPEYDYTYTEDSYVGEEYVKDYVTYHSFDLKVYTLSEVGTLADLVIDHGANAINNISYGVENTDKAELQARKKAFAQAKTRARQLASLAGGTLGNATYVNEYTYVPYCCDYYGNYSVSYDMAVDGEKFATTVPEPGQIDIQVDVSLTFELKFE